MLTVRAGIRQGRAETVSRLRVLSALCGVVGKGRVGVVRVHPCPLMGGNMAKDVVQLVDEHWAYVKETLAVHGVDAFDVAIIGHHYRSAMEHGYKHGIEAGKVQGCRCNGATVGDES